MTFVNRFMTLSEQGRKLRKGLLASLSSKNIALSCVVFTWFLFNPLSLQADEKPAGATKTEATSKADDLLTSIEEMIMNMDLQRESTSSPSELPDNPNPTAFFSSIPNIKPVNGPITSTFGTRVHPLYNISLFHSGIDISASEGTKVQTTGDGVVAFSGYEKGYGQKITINHGYGYITIYAHLSKSFVRQGQKVKRGEIIALTGNTGTSTGPHLHYEIQKDNIKVNPTAFFFDETTPDKFITIQKSVPEQSGNKS